MMNFPACDWHYLFGKPTCRAQFKTTLSDFLVEEDLGYALSGEGEHTYVQIQKTNLNTAYVAEQLAKFTQLPLRQISYAGRKDKYATTTQWFGVHNPQHKPLVWRDFTLDGVQVLDAQQHHKKLKVGALKGNQFTIRLRQCEHLDNLLERIVLVASDGVPNYYGQQRFGEMHYRDEHGQSGVKLGGNLTLAAELVAGRPIKNRNKRSLAISALRSWLFNRAVSARIEQQLFSVPLTGDAFILNGSNSFFVADNIDDLIIKRLAEGDIHLSAPLSGAGQLITKAASHAFESDLLSGYPEVTETLTKLGLKQERRALRLLPQDLTCEPLSEQEGDCVLRFYLPSGTFATSVLRELCQW